MSVERRCYYCRSLYVSYWLIYEGDRIASYGRFFCTQHAHQEIDSLARCIKSGIYIGARVIVKRLVGDMPPAHQSPFIPTLRASYARIAVLLPRAREAA